MAGENNIRDKLAKLEALFAHGATAGERAAAGAARDRLQARLGLDLDDNDEPETEMQYSLPDVWSFRTFVALCRKHGIRPYRYPRQRRTTGMVRVPLERESWNSLLEILQQWDRYLKDCKFGARY